MSLLSAEAVERNITLPLLEGVLFEVLGCLGPRDVGKATAVARPFRDAAEAPLLWLHLYSALYRDHLPKPPGFREVRQGAVASLELAAFSWKELALHRLRHQHRRIRTRLRLEAAPAERRGMIDAHCGGGPLSAVLQEPLVPLPLARPISYVEIWVLGGASVGLIRRPQTADVGREGPPYNSTHHIGWGTGSFGWHGDEGAMYLGSSWGGVPFGPTFGFQPELVHRNAGPDVPKQPDVVGIGVERVHADRREHMFCTKNGRLVGAVPLPRGQVGFPNEYYFAFALNARGDFASVNYGSARFVFDLEAYSMRQPHPRTIPLIPRNGPRDDDMRAIGAEIEAGLEAATEEQLDMMRAAMEAEIEAMMAAGTDDDSDA
eukprot:CAMPEP_0119265738 /NCGR_PEP_ID=MMETSP1329-20130426/4449_1 /TAXON_ID=114041 /ORGANISM="Genus nov. species nov., Strain RCC1024" /LENGTH=374 /DNA_ID=CAMNT_0007265585 /DNA_START=116 /DNA_END=1237 /DNA_ORIENTATION=+